MKITSLKFIFLSLTILISWPCYSAPVEIHFSKSWNLKVSKTDFQVFVDQQDKQKTITVAWFETPQAKNLNQSSVHSEIQKMQSTRSGVNALIGLSDWKIEKSEFKEEGSTKTLLIEGSYSSEGEKFKFWEHQIFIGKKYYQIKVISNAVRSPNRDELESLFQAVKVK